MLSIEQVEKLMMRQIALNYLESMAKTANFHFLKCFVIASPSGILAKTLKPMPYRFYVVKKSFKFI